MSSDGVSFSLVATFSRVGGGWSATGVTQPVGQIFHLRARGRTTGGYYDGSQGLLESTRQFFGNDGIFADGFE